MEISETEEDSWSKYYFVWITSLEHSNTPRFYYNGFSIYHEIILSEQHLLLKVISFYLISISPQVWHQHQAHPEVVVLQLLPPPRMNQLPNVPGAPTLPPPPSTVTPPLPRHGPPSGVLPRPTTPRPLRSGNDHAVHDSPGQQTHMYIYMCILLRMHTTVCPSSTRARYIHMYMSDSIYIYLYTVGSVMHMHICTCKEYIFMESKGHV